MALNDVASNGRLADARPITNGHTNGLTNGQIKKDQSSSNSTEDPEHRARVNGNSSTDGHTQNADAADGVPPKPIAICGMACRLPKGVNTPHKLWEFLLAGDDARSIAPSSRYDVESFYDPSGKPGTIKTQHGYFLEEDLAKLDTSFFSMPRKEVERLDPQQRLMLEVARECFEDAGEVSWRGKNIGCYMGNLGEDWLEMLASDPQNFGIYRLSGYGDFSLSNRVSFEMDLKGPSMTIRTACSASMVALHEACVAIDRGDCTSAIVGGTNLILRPGCTTLMSEQNVLSPDGSSNTFSTSANGYARGEAIVGVFLKPLEDALRDGNAIQAVIRATATNHDGRTAGFTLPSSEAQEAMIRRAYEVAGLPVSDTAYVECHGTGTSVGDPIETRAVARVFGQNGGMTIGSVKPNFGHTEGASGILSVLKAVLMLKYKAIPPSIKFTPKNPNIPWESGRLSLAESPLAWPEKRLGRVSVNSFGLGGTNAHAIIDSAADHRRQTDSDTQTEHTSPQLLLYSANTEQSLAAIIEDYKTFVEETEADVRDVAYSLARGREHLPYRAFAVANGPVVGAPSSIGKPPGQRKPKIAMVFTGQGAQWPQMCEHLLRFNSTFRSSIRSLDRYVGEVLGEDAPAWSIEDELLKPKKKSRVNVAEFSQPLCTAVQIALVDTLRWAGIEADAVTGHSSGEIAGAYAAGVLTAGEAIIVALFRGIATSLQKRPGAMAALGMGVEDSEKFLVPGTVIACENSPRSVTMSGDADKIAEVLASVQTARPDVLARKLQVDKAYHSHHMAEIGDMYGSMIENQISARSPNKLFFSSVENRQLDGTIDPRYWQKNLESPVLFNGAVTNILEYYSGQDVVLLEVGPHSALAGPLTQIMSEVPNIARYVPTIVRNRDSTECLLSAVGKLFTFHVPIDCKALFPHGSCLPDLPRYPFLHSESNYWFESRLSKEYRLRKHPHHDLLGSKAVESTDLDPVWRNQLHINYGAAWLKDHKIGDDIVFPFAGYAAIAGEAVRQVTKLEDAFRLRRVSVVAAMLLSEEGPTEVVTSLRPLRLTISQDSSWYEFTISAYNGHKWTKHCSGEVKAESRALPAGAIPPKPFARAVDRDRWFEGASRDGLCLGDDFQNLEAVTAATTSFESRGTVSSRKHAEANSPSRYHVHPAVLDSMIQLLPIASSNGLVRRYQSYLPTYCDELFVARTAEDFVAHFHMDHVGSGPNSSRVGDGRGYVDGRIVVRFDGLKFVPATVVDQGADALDPHAASRLIWAADLDFVDLETLFKTSPHRQEYALALESLGRLAVLAAQHRLADVHAQRPHLRRYAQWVDTQSQLHKPSLYDEETQSPWMRQLCDTLADTPAAPVAEVINAVVTNIDALVTNTVASWQMLVPATTAVQFLDFVSEFDSSRFFETLGHYKPNLRILELSNWTRSPSPAVLKALTLPTGRHLWSQYTFASEDSIAAEEQIKGYPALEYISLDICEDLITQGFEGGQYDIVVANNVLHATPNLGRSLRNIASLLAPNGRLFLQELTPVSTWINIVLGTAPTWWRGGADGRADEAYVSASRWQSELAAAGFDAPETTVFDSGVTSRVNCIMVARPARALSTDINNAPKPIDLLVRDKTQTHEIENVLRGRGFAPSKITLDDAPRPGTDIVSILDLDAPPFLENIAEGAYHSLQRFLTASTDVGIFWVTRPCQVRVRDPRYAQIIGLARVLRSELALDFATCEVGDGVYDDDRVDRDAPWPLVCRVFEKFHARGLDEETLLPDYEFVVEGDEVQIGRFFPFRMADGFDQESDSERMKVALGTPGHPNALQWLRQPGNVVLEADDAVEIEMHAVGVNFKDVLVGMGLIEAQGGHLGLEGAGVVRRVGAKVRDFVPGDRVAVLEQNAMASLLVSAEKKCIKIPDSLGFMEAATMFTAYATVLHSFGVVGRLREGESVLIHSACGGVGLAAIQVARMMRAEIYVTVGSEEKVQYLIRNHGMPRNRIYNSRDDSFVEEVRRETNGRGVDMILNSLSGELLHETWKCLAPFGRLIEIGKRELIGHGRLDMEPFLANRSYCCVAVDGFHDGPHAYFREMMGMILENLAKGTIKPIPIAKEFEASAVGDALKYLLPGTHIGRIGIRIRDDHGHLTVGDGVITPPRRLEFSPDASYLLIGGLGGLGRAISTYMVEHGARHLIYFSTRAGQGESSQAFIRELESMGVDVLTVRGNVHNLDDVSRAVSQARTPLKGVLQLAAVLADQSFPLLTKEQWDYSLGPKVAGTWNLHLATLSAELDFFVLTSSLSAIIGIPGQANYASGNSFLDAFVQYRNNLGLACSAVNIGPVADIGFFAESSGLLQTATLTGFKTLREQEVIDSVALCMMAEIPDSPSTAGGTAQFFDPNIFVLGLASTVPLSSPTNRVVWKRSRPMAIYHNSDGGSGGSGSGAAASSDQLTALLMRARADPALLKDSETVGFFAEEIGRRLFILLLKEDTKVNTELALADLGLDSLVAIELRSWWKKVFGFDISVLEMLAMGNLELLGKHVAERLLSMYVEENKE